MCLGLDLGGRGLGYGFRHEAPEIFWERFQTAQFFLVPPPLGVSCTGLGGLPGTRGGAVKKGSLIRSPNVLQGWEMMFPSGQWCVEAYAGPPTPLLRAVRAARPRAPIMECFFAKMPAHTAIKPHSDYTNFVLTCHLGLKTPPKSHIACGDARHEWRCAHNFDAILPEEFQFMVEVRLYIYPASCQLPPWLLK